MYSWNERFSFDSEKAVEIFVLVAQKAPIPDIYHLAKICYFADLLHLERYGRPVCGDNYIKMENGPVPSELYSMFKAVKAGKKEGLSKSFKVSGNNITALRDYDEDEFSPSDLKCLFESIETHGSKSFSQLKRESHDLAWEAAQDNREIDYLNMIKVLPNSDDLISYLGS